MAMHKLQIMIPKEQYAWLKEKAQAEGKSIGQIVREAIERLRGTAAVATLPPLEEDPAWQIVGMFRGGPPYDVSVRHDDYLYGDYGKEEEGEETPH